MTEGVGRPGADPATLRALTHARATTRSLSDDLLTHLPDVGDLTTQRLLDAWVEQAADTMRALAEGLEERLLELARPVPTDHSTGPGSPIDGSPIAGSPSGPAGSGPEATGTRWFR